MPIRFCLKNAGPLESITVIRAMINIGTAKIISPTKDSIISKNLLTRAVKVRAAFFFAEKLKNN